MDYLNINKEMSYVKGEDRKYKRQELIDYFIKEIKKSEILIKDFKKIADHYCLYVDIDNKNIIVELFIKNITGAGWENKPNIKRCQVKNFSKEDNNFSEVENHYYLIIGYYNYDGNPILVAWDAYRYLSHNTQRSCYVTVETLKIGYEKNIYEGVVMSQKCWAFIGSFFKEFIKKYIEYINTFYLKG